MKVEVKELEGLKRELTVEIPVDTVEGEISKKLTELRQKVKIDGFRQGKVPMERIKTMYGDSVRADVVEELIRSTYPEAVREKTLRVASHPTVTGADFGDDGHFEYTAEVEVFPEIEKVACEGLEVKLREVEVEDKDVDEFVEHLRKRFADMRPVDREVRDNDVVLVDMKKTFDPGMVLKEDTFPDQEIDLDSKMTIKEFHDALPGMKADEETEIEIKYPDDYSDKNFAGAHIKYHCRVREVRERILPEFNDDFAKQTGDAETALELRLKIRDDLKMRIKDEQEREKRGQIIQQMCKQNDIPVPDGLIEDYLKNVAEDFKKRYNEVDEAKIKENYRDIGLRTIRWNMIYNHLSGQESIEVLPSDTEDRIKRFADNYQMTLDQAKQALAQSGTVADIRDSILEEKVLDFLADKATVVAVKPEDAKEK